MPRPPEPPQAPHFSSSATCSLLLWISSLWGSCLYLSMSSPIGAAVFPAAYRATSFISTTTSTSSITACERSRLNTCGLQEAESFPAAHNLRDCLWALGVSSRFGVHGLFFAVFTLTTVGRTSLSNVPNGNLAGCRGRHKSLQRVHCHRRIRSLGNSTPLFLSTGRG